jgi:hypothetical protein
MHSINASLTKHRSDLATCRSQGVKQTLLLRWQLFLMLCNFQCAISRHGHYQVLSTNGRNNLLTNKHTWDWGSHSGIAEDPRLGEYYTVDGGTVPKIPKEPSALIKSPKQNRLSTQTARHSTWMYYDPSKYQELYNNTTSLCRRHQSSISMQFCNKPHQYWLYFTSTEPHTYNCTSHSYHRHVTFSLNRDASTKI